MFNIFCFFSKQHSIPEQGLEFFKKKQERNKLSCGFNVWCNQTIGNSPLGDWQRDLGKLSGWIIVLKRARKRFSNHLSQNWLIRWFLKIFCVSPAGETRFSSKSLCKCDFCYFLRKWLNKSSLQPRKVIRRSFKV